MDDSFDKQVTLVLRLAIGFDRVLEHKISEIAVHDFLQYFWVAKFFYDFLLYLFRSFVDTNLYEFWGKLILGKLDIVAFDAGKNVLAGLILELV